MHRALLLRHARVPACPLSCVGCHTPNMAHCHAKCLQASGSADASAAAQLRRLTVVQVCAAADDAVGALLEQVPAPFALELLRHKLPIPGAAKVGVPEAAVVQVMHAPCSFCLGPLSAIP